MSSGLDLFASVAPTSVPALFTGFAARTGLSLTAGQLCFARVAYDGADVLENDRAHRMFGDVKRIPRDARKVINQVKGRDSGGSRLGALRLLHLALTLPLDKIDKAEVAYAIFTGPKLRHARIGLRFALMAAQRNGVRIVGEPNKDGFTIQRPDGRRVCLECFAASRGGDTGRGVPIVAALLDEAAFYFDENTGVVNDRAIFNALVPRLIPGGQILIVSSPWAEAGLLYEEFKRNHGRPETSLAAFCPTLVMRDDADTIANVEQETKRDPQNAAREYGAEFISVTSEQFFDPRAIDAAIDAAIILPRPRIYGAAIGMGGDFAFTKNSSALVCVQRTLTKYITSLVEERIPDTGPLKPSIVVGEFARAMRPYGSDTLMADGHYRQSIQEHLEAASMYLQPAPEGQIGKADTHQRARTILHEGGVRLPNHPKLVSQLKAIVKRPTPGGGVSIISPKSSTGAHGDVASAWVLAMWQASLGVPENDAIPAQPGTADYERFREEQRMARLAEEFERGQSDEQDYYSSDNEWIRSVG